MTRTFAHAINASLYWGLLYGRLVGYWCNQPMRSFRTLFTSTPLYMYLQATPKHDREHKTPNQTWTYPPP